MQHNNYVISTSFVVRFDSDYMEKETLKNVDVASQCDIIKKHRKTPINMSLLHPGWERFLTHPYRP